MKTLKYIGATTFLALSLASCDNVSEPDRFVPTEIVPQRAILIEEYTGQRCTNCPDGHAAIRDITGQLGDSVVAVGIHAGDLAVPTPMGFRTPTADEYYKDAGNPALPTAVINLQTPPLMVTDWGAAINRLIITPTPFTVKAQGEADGNNFNIKVAVSAGEDYKGKLMVWICENDIVSMQLDHGTVIPDYVHNHVFRAAATDDIWGESVSLSAHKAQYFTFSKQIEDYWEAKNLYVVAFLYNDAGVAQVTQTH